MVVCFAWWGLMWVVVFAIILCELRHIGVKNLVILGFIYRWGHKNRFDGLSRREAARPKAQSDSQVRLDNNLTIWLSVVVRTKRLLFEEDPRLGGPGSSC